MFDPQIDGGLPNGYGRGDITPDGRITVAFRRVPSEFDSECSGLQRYALTVAAVNPGAFETNEYGHLEAFTNSAGEYVFGEGGTSDWFQVQWNGQPYWANALVDWVDGVDPPGERIQTVPGSCLEHLETQQIAGPFKFDLTHPLGINAQGTSMMSVGLRPPEPGHTLGNPYPSDGLGTADESGTYTTYDLMLLRFHAQNHYDPDTQTIHLEANPSWGSLVAVKPLPISNPNYDGEVLVSQRLKVVLDSGGQIHDAWIEPVNQKAYQKLTTGGLVIPALEPSMTADCKLIVFNGGGDCHDVDEDDYPVDFPGLGRITYIFNETPLDPTTWSQPRSLATLPDTGDVTNGDLEFFKDSYKVFRNPIKLPPSAEHATATAGGQDNTATYVHVAGDGVRGPYPWISKDGSFYIGGSVQSLEESQQSQRAGTYACGDITGGYMKYIDDTGVNPSRWGADWHWPPQQAAGKWKPSWRSVFFTPGLRPGPWEMLVDDKPPFPSQVASTRIPILPIVFTISDVYGEVRFEEADGNYLMYLACNESLMRDPDEDDDPDPPNCTTTGTLSLLINDRSTPDTSGLAVRGYGALNPGAAFARDALALPSQLNDPAVDVLREEIGLNHVPQRESLHENVGFRGQGITLNADGNVDVAPGKEQIGGDDATILGTTQFTVQAFVKRLTPWPQQAGEFVLVEHGQRRNAGGQLVPALELGIDGFGVPFVSAQITVTQSGNTVPVDLSSNLGALSDGNDIYDVQSGWHHLAVTYTGDNQGFSRLTLWVDGVVANSGSAAATSSLDALEPNFVPYTLVGPGRSASPTPITGSNWEWVLDEVAISDVARTKDELRRDAYVPLDENFEPWPGPVAELPLGFDEDDAKWPEGVPFDQAIADLEELLFRDDRLSVSGQMSCATCHDPDGFFVDGLNHDPLNTPTILNSLFGTHKTFSGQAKDLEQQLTIPLQSATEMGPQTMTQLVNRIDDEIVEGTNPPKTYDTLFGELFTIPAWPEAGLTEKNLGSAIAMYERTQFAESTDFDEWNADHGAALNVPAGAINGRGLFFGKARCFACHTGPNFTDDDFHNILSVTDTDVEDRAFFTGRAREAGALKTPTLRNLDHTADYFHDGSKPTLRAVIEHYNDPPFDDQNVVGHEYPDRFLRPLELTSGEMDDLEVFLLWLSEQE